ncbi:MAG: hypothetical protein P8Z39_00640 [Gammaproteobacteria bacterium]|jgi:hypothetical protein
MSDDWRKKRAVTSDKSENSIALDSLGIPILDEVVAAEEDYQFDQDMISALTHKLRSQLRHDMGDITTSVANIVVANITAGLKQQISTQLTQILEQHLDRLIKKAISENANGESAK